MPPLETSSLFQKAVLFPRTGTDRYGQPTTGSAVEIPCRWKTERREVVTSTGDTIGLDATVTVDRKIAIGSLMWLGTLKDWNASGSSPGISDTELHEVKVYDETPDIKGRAAYRDVGLMRYLNSKGQD